MSSENWQLSSDAAVLYEKYVHPLMVPWVEAMVEKAKIREGERVLLKSSSTFEFNELFNLRSVNNEEGGRR